MRRQPPWRTLVAALSLWFEENARPMPWRERRNPYAIWLSEVMLQQTRVETVIPYWERFLSRWPTVESLAAATTAQVLKEWEGLGYYARARRLPEAARFVVASGGWPRTAEALREVPGIGPYTAGAVASIAFGEAAPLLDGNVKRVWSRLFAFPEPPVGKPLDLFWEWSAQAVRHGKPAVVNQALMELGATVCTPRAPKCPECPLRSWCCARKEGKPESYPRKVPKPAVPTVQVAVGILLRRGRFLVLLRPEEGLLGGLWELPGGKIEAGEGPGEAMVRELREELGCAVLPGAPLPPVRHAYSHFKVVLHPFLCTLAPTSPDPCPGRPMKWLRPGEVGNLPFPRATLKVFEAWADLRGGH